MSTLQNTPPLESLAESYWKLVHELEGVEKHLHTHIQVHITARAQELHELLTQAAGKALSIAKLPESIRSPESYAERLQALHRVIAKHKEEISALLEASRDVGVFLADRGFHGWKTAEEYVVPAPGVLVESDGVADALTEELPFEEPKPEPKPEPEPEPVIEVPAEPDIKRIGGEPAVEDEPEAQPNPLQEALLESATQDYPGMAEKLAVAELTFVESDNKVLVKDLPMTGNERRWFTQKVRDILGDKIKIDSP